MQFLEICKFNYPICQGSNRKFSKKSNFLTISIDFPGNFPVFHQFAARGGPKSKVSGVKFQPLGGG